ncbi:MAG: MMPL family transporter, partial [Gemmatimonadota bacterium]|nr:MMPL family transporter [Gemmatimonadota bacterium]
MSGEARTWAERRLLRWSRAVRRRRRLVLGLAPAVTALASWIAVRGLGVNTDTGSLVSDELDFRRTYREYLDAFPQSQDELIVLIEAETPARADAAAGRLARELAADTSTFRSVYRPAGGPYFDRAGLLFRDHAAIEELVARAAPYTDLLVSVEADPTLGGLASALETVAAGREEEAGGSDAVSDDLDLRPVLQLLARSVFEASEGRITPVPWSALLAGELPEVSERRRTLILRPRLAYENAVPGRAAMERVRRAARDLGLVERNGVRVRLTGTVAIEAEELDTAVAGVRRTGALAAVAVALILFVALRSPKLILASLATLAAGLAVTSAFAALAVGQLNLISVAFAVLYVGLGIDYAIHLCLRYRTHRGAGCSSADAIDRAVVQVGPSLVLSALTTAACFFAFIPTDFVGVSELGLIGGIGMFVSLIATLTLLPASLAAFPPSRPQGRARGIPWLRSVVRGRGIPILAVAALATAAAATVLPRSRFDANPLNLRDPASESMSAYRALLEDPASRPLTVNLLVADTAAARDTVRKLLALPEVEAVRTLGSFVPGEQDAKLEALSGLELPFAPARSRPDESPDVARLRAAVTALRW